jgi:hypothetical protein
VRMAVVVVMRVGMAVLAMRVIVRMRLDGHARVTSFDHSRADCENPLVAAARSPHRPYN